MSLSTLLASIEQDIARRPQAFAEARARRGELAPYSTASDVRRALEPSSSLSASSRYALVAALVEEAQRAASPLWSSLLLTVFAPMLQRLRRRLARPRDEDLDSAVIAAFLAAVRDARIGPFTTVALRWATEKEVLALCRADRQHASAAPFDEEIHGIALLEDGPRERALDEVVRILEAEGAGELLDVLVATRGRDESLRAYVVRTAGDATPREIGARYERLCRARLRFEKELRERLDRRAA